MKSRQTIAIIGAESDIAILAERLSRENYRLLLISGEGAGTGSLAASIRQFNPAADIECSQCPFDASWEADIIILAIQPGAEAEIARRIRQVATQKIVIRFSTADAAPAGNEPEALQQLLPDAKVVSIFLMPATALEVSVAGGDLEAVQAAKALVQAAGFMLAAPAGASSPQPGNSSSHQPQNKIST